MYLPLNILLNILLSKLLKHLLLKPSKILSLWPSQVSLSQHSKIPLF